MDTKQRNVMIFGAVTGVIAVTPSISTWINKQLIATIPATYLFGSTGFALGVYGAIAGAIIGLIVLSLR
jgi:hypothetical protein